MRTATATIAAMLAAAALAGCGGVKPADTSAGGPQESASTRAAFTTTEPQVTTGTVTTPDPSTLPGYKLPVIQLGDMNTNEQFILGELYDLALKQQGYSVVLSRNIGTTQISQAALQQGSLMLYPEYLNVWNSQVAHNSGDFKTRTAAYNAAEQYASRHGWMLLAPTPFSNTSGIAVSAQYARLNDLYSLQQLTSRASVTLGAPLEFAQARTGLPGLEQAYDFKPSFVRSIDIGDQYSALTSGTIQASYVTSTDPQLSTSQFVLLRDPLHVFGFGNVVPVTTTKVVADEGPAFVETINAVDALLTQSAIRGLNYEVTIQHADPEVVARQFLAGNGLLPAVEYRPATSTTSTTTTQLPSTTKTTTTAAKSPKRSKTRGRR